MPRLPTKREEKLAYARTLGEGKALQKLESKETFWDKIQGHLWHFLDRLDPLDVAAVGALTVIIKPIVQKIPDIADAMAKNLPFGANLVVQAVQKDKIVIFNVKNPITGEILWEWSVENPTGQTLEPSDYVPPIPELNAWIFSLALAVLIVKFGPALIESAGGLQGLAKMIVGKPA